MIITGSLNFKRNAKKIAKELNAKFVPRGKKSFKELLELSRFYGEELGIVYKKGGALYIRVISYDKDEYFKERLLCIEEE